MCYNSFVKSARSFRALRTMRPHHAFLLTPSNLCAFACFLPEQSPHPTRLIPRPHTVRVSPLDATLMVFPASVANKRLTVWLSPLDATLTKNSGEGGLLLLTRHATKHVYPERPSGAEGSLSHAAKCVCLTRPNVPVSNPRIAQNPVAHPSFFSITCAMPLSQLLSFDNFPFSWGGGVPPPFSGRYDVTTFRRFDVSILSPCPQQDRRLHPPSYI
jgi:hypothetical protein